MIGALQGQRLAQDGSCSRRVAPPITCRFHFDHTGTLFFHLHKRASLNSCICTLCVRCSDTWGWRPRTHCLPIRGTRHTGAVGDTDPIIETIPGDGYFTAVSAAPVPEGSSKSTFCFKATILGQPLHERILAPGTHLAVLMAVEEIKIFKAFSLTCTTKLSPLLMCYCSRG